MRLVLAMIGARIVLNGTEVRILCDDYAKLDWPIEAAGGGGRKVQNPIAGNRACS
jgi:hypothetical protein